MKMNIMLLVAIQMANAVAFRDEVRLEHAETMNEV